MPSGISIYGLCSRERQVSATHTVLSGAHIPPHVGDWIWEA